MNNTDLKNKYNPEGSNLRELQLRMLEILKEVDQICKKHNIQYWLSSGTLLGAVRHGGFIPWDDDLDIEMQREDFKKFMSVLSQELPENLTLQSDKSDRNYIYFYPRIRDKNSYIYERSEQNRALKEKGAFIDVFPLESTFLVCHKIVAKLLSSFAWRLVLKTGFKRKMYDIYRFVLAKMVIPFFRLISCLAPTNRLYHSLGSFFHIPRYKNEIFPLTQISFEGCDFPCPHDYDKYLNRLYGDYMRLPDSVDYHTDTTLIEICKDE